MAKALQPYGLATQPLTISSKEGEVTFSIQQDPNSNKPYARFSRRRRRLVPSISGMKTETELEEIIWLGQENETFEQLVMYFGQELIRRRQLQTNPILAAFIHQMCENVCIIGQQLALWNDIRSTALRQTEVAKSVVAKSIPPIASKEDGGHLKLKKKNKKKKKDKIKSKLANMNYESPEELQKFFKAYSGTTIPLGSPDGHTFTVWEGRSSDMERNRLLQYGVKYVNPPEKLIILGYLDLLDEDIVIMVGKQTGRVFMDEDEIVYVVAESLSEFTDQGCRKDPKFFDYYLSRPNDPNSLPCAAGTCKNEHTTLTVPEDLKSTIIVHDPKQLEADDEEATQLYAEWEDYLDSLPEEDMDFCNEADGQNQSLTYSTQYGSTTGLFFKQSFEVC